MTIASTFRAGMVADSGVSALVSQRIYPGLLPQHPTYPAISYQRISNTGQKGTSDIRESRWQINNWAQTYAGAQALAAAFKAFAEDYADVTQTPGIKQTLVVNENDDYDDEAKAYRVIVDVILYTTGD